MLTACVLWTPCGLHCVHISERVLVVASLCFHKQMGGSTEGTQTGEGLWASDGLGVAISWPLKHFNEIQTLQGTDP